MINENSKLIDVINKNYYLLPVLNRFNIRLGFGDSTLKSICIEQKLNLDFVLSILNTTNDPEYFPENTLLSFSPELIINYLRKTHLYYYEFAIPNLENLLKVMLNDFEGDNTDLRILMGFYNKYKEELINHIKDEEEFFFPYVLNISNRFQNPNLKQAEIRTYEEIHANADEKLEDLKAIIIKHMKPLYKDNHCNNFLFSLYRFEKDLKDHARIEDKILMPLVKELERNIFKND